MHDQCDEHDRGLAVDLRHLISRRRALGLAGATLATGTLAACDKLPFFSEAEADFTATGPDGRECVADPRETTGPFPADGSNEAHGTLANVLAQSGVVRRDMRTGIAPSEPKAEGAMLELTLSLVNVNSSCAPLAGHAVYLWHCDAAGRYSIYDLAETSYLRAVGVSDVHGWINFLTIVPGCYEGRYPHMHFEVYPSLEATANYRNRLLTSQLAVPADLCTAVYDAHPAYRESLAHFAKSPLDRDGIFGDNTPKQLAVQTLKVAPLDIYGVHKASVTIGLKPKA